MSTITLTIGGLTYTMLEGSLNVSEQVDNRSTCTLSIVDDTGLHFQKGQPISITDSLTGTLFSGFIHDVTETKLVPNAAIKHDFNCVDNVYLADKRLAQKTYTNEYAGDIASDLLGTYLNAEGVTSSYATDFDSTQANFAAGTLTNTVATTNVEDGDLELSLSGSTVTFSQSSQANFNAGTTGGLSSPASGGVTFTSTPAIKLQATCSLPGLPNAYSYVEIWNNSLGSYTIPSSFPTLFYDVWIPDTCPQQMAGIDIVFTDGSTLRDVPQANIYPDDQHVYAHPKNDLSGLATNQWYHRQLPLYGPSTSLAGKVIRYITVAFEGDNQGNYIAYFRNVSVSNFDRSSQLAVFLNTATAIAITPIQIGNSGYSNMSCTIATTYERHGYMYSPSFSLASASLAGTSSLSWDITLPDTNFTFTITASLDGFSTFLPCTNKGPVPGLLPGMNLSSRSIFLVYVFDNAGNDPTLTPFLKKVEGTINPAYAATKSDVRSLTNTSTGWSGGTLTNLINSGSNTLQLNGFARDWDDANYSNQTVFGSGNPSQTVVQKQLQLATNQGADVRSRFDFAGNAWQNFTMEVDITLPTGSTSYVCSLVYRTTNWGNSNDSYAYTANLSTTFVQLGRGTNSTGAGSFTSIVSVGLSLTQGSTYHMTVIVSGTNHQVFVDGVQYINATDSTYSAAGYVGLRFYNNTSGSEGCFFDNFGIVSNLSGTWVSPAIDISSLSTISGSQLTLQIDPSINFTLCTFLAEISLNNGSTWTTCPNSQTALFGGLGYFQTNPVPGLTAGTNVSSMMQVKIRLTITASTASVGALMPDITACNLTVTGAYSSSGTRVSPVLSLNNVGRAGSTLIAWSANLPTGTTLGVDTSPDGSTWTDVTSENGGPVPGITTQPVPFVDSFVNQPDWNSVDIGPVGAAGSAVRSLSGVWTIGGSGADIWGTSDAFHFVYQVSPGSPFMSGRIVTQQNTNGFAKAGFMIRKSVDQQDLYYAVYVTPSNGIEVQCRTAYGGSAFQPATAAGAAPQYLKVGQSGTTFTAYTSSDGITYTAISGSATTISGMTGTVLAGMAVTSHNMGTISSCTFDGVSVFNGPTPTYTSTHYGSGTTGTWWADTANSRMVATTVNNADGDNAVLLYNPWSYTDGYIEFDTDTADDSGAVLQYSGGTPRMYLIKVQDASATSGVANTVGLYKRVSGSTSQLGSNASISFARGVVHRFRLDKQGSAITVMMDGTQIISYTDGSPLVTAGQYALRAGKSGNFYSVRLQPYGDLLTGKNLYSRLRLASTEPTVTPQVTQLSLSVHSPDIGNGVLMPTFDTTNTYVSNAFNSLATAANYTWTIDKNLKLIFHDRTTMPTPFPISSSDILVNEAAQCQVVNSADMYRNQQTVKGGTDTQSFTKTVMGDGLNQAFTMPYPLAAAPTITVNGNAAIVGVKGVDTGKDFYYAIGDAVIIQDASETPLTSFDTLVVSGSGTIPVTVTVSSSSGIADRLSVEGGSGIVENIEDASSLGLNKAAATQLANSLLARYCIVGRTITFTTLRPGLAIGEYLTLFFPEHGIWDDACLLTKLTTSIVTSGTTISRWYAVEATEGPNLTNWAKAIVGQ